MTPCFRINWEELEKLIYGNSGESWRNLFLAFDIPFDQVVKQVYKTTLVDPRDLKEKVFVSFTLDGTRKNQHYTLNKIFLSPVLMRDLEDYG